MQNDSIKAPVIVGLALFAMFFGAGNIIFPPYIGVVSGTSWPVSFFAYYLMDIGLAIVAILAMIKSDTLDQPESVMLRLGKWPSRILMFGIVYSLGFIAGPRTCAVSFELGVKPILGDNANLAIYSTLFFLIAWMLTIRESKMIEIIGKWLTPTLVVGLLIVIGISIFSPLGEMRTTPQIDNVWYMGLIAGYQTLDVPSALVYAFVVSMALANAGFTTTESKVKGVMIASAVVGVLMFVIYGGLCYIGATASTIYGPDVQHGDLVVILFQKLLGVTGSGVLGILVLLACLTTAIALIGAPATFLVRVSEGKLKYNYVVTLLCFAYALIANLGLSTILSIAIPIILALYPATLVMVLLSLFNDKIENDNVFKTAAGFALIFSLLEALKSQGVEAANIIEIMPLQEHGFGWILPGICGAAVGYFLKPSEPADQAA